MGATVFANGMSIACKVSSGKTTAAMPDVCLSPPSPPAGPIPIPYPNTASASDTDKGSTTVSIGGEPVMLKDSSEFKTSTGNEAATRNFGMGVVTHKIQGVATFVAWSMDVKFEGQNVPRHMDLMGHNEACDAPPNCPVWPFLDAGAFSDSSHPCHTMATEMLSKCEKHLPKSGPVDVASVTAAMCADKDCEMTRKCVMVPENKEACCSGKTPHHAIPAGEFLKSRLKQQARGTPAVGTYKTSDAPCLCVDGKDHDAREEIPPHRLMEHGRLGAEFTRLRNITIGKQKTYKYSQASPIAAQAVENTTGCKKECAQAQIDSGHRAMSIGNSDDLRRSKQKANVPETLPSKTPILKAR